MGGATSPAIFPRSHSNSIGKISAFASRFARDERGVSAVFFGIMFTTLFLGAAIAIDYTRATRELMEQQTALDAAMLAASHELGNDDEDTVGQARAEKFFAANMPADSTATVSVDLDGEAGEINGSTTNRMGTTLMRSGAMREARRDYIDIGVTSRVVKGNGTFEIALVLDNSGSMAGTYITDLKTAANSLVTKVFAGADGGEKIKVGVVPFASSVNVGSMYADASWMDTGAAASTHSENFDTTKSRFELYDDLGFAWDGCVEARPAPYDVTDEVPSSGTPDTLFVPMFAPDEPDDANASAAGYSSYANNYISDYGGTCPVTNPTCASYSRRGNCTRWVYPTLPVADAQKRTCKYANATVSGGTPNHGCNTRAILALANSKSTVQSAIDAMSAGGNTNIGEGTMWGWRVLSPSEPFTDGRAYSDTENTKILVIMTDGANTYTATTNHNLSRYNAFGYGVKGRLGTTYTSSAYSDAMDVKLTSACTNAKAAGVKIYTVAFRLESDAATQALLKSCATDDDHYYAASGGNALIQAFENIGQEISKLRVAG